MAQMCAFWRLTPSEYWALTQEEHDALARYVSRVAEASRASR